jgi:hypothetical protein
MGLVNSINTSLVLQNRHPNFKICFTVLPSYSRGSYIYTKKMFDGQTKVTLEPNPAWNVHLTK